MSRILVTGSSQGIGAEAARALAAQGHEVAVHGRNAERAAAAADAVPEAVASLTGALDDMTSTRAFAAQARDVGPWDVIVHNAALGPARPAPERTRDGLEAMFHVNVVAPYLLSCLLHARRRLVYVGSDASDQGTLRLDDLNWTARAWDPWQAYNDSKLYVSMIAMVAAERLPSLAVNVVHPGWVRTSMGGPNAQLPLGEGADSIVWLAGSDDPAATATGRFIDRRAERALNPLARDRAHRADLIAALVGITGEKLPAE